MLLFAQPSVTEYQAPPQPELKTGCEAYKDIVRSYDWESEIAIKVMMAESGCNPQALNSKDQHKGCVGSLGLFQIGCLHEGASFDPIENIDIAYKLYTESGWKPWGVCDFERTCAVLK